MQAVIQTLGNLILSAQGQHSQSANLGLAYIFSVEQLKPYASIYIYTHEGLKVVMTLATACIFGFNAILTRFSGSWITVYNVV